ncbi:MAG: Hsp33 family molecular chaperone HslO [Bacillota bacterium]
MNNIIKSIIYDKAARVTLIDTTQALKEAVITHNLSPLAAAITGRALTAGAYISANLKGKDSKFSMIINGGGPAGNVVVAGESGNTIRGFVSNPFVQMPLKNNGKLDVGGAVGKKGQISVIKDYGMKEPYRGNCQLVSGEIGEDFAYYLLKSEGIKSAVSLGVKVNKDGIIASGGIIVEALPNIEENQLFIIENIMNDLKNISSIMEDKTIEDIFDYYFSHLNGKILSKEELNYKCNCSLERIKNIIMGLGKDEVYDILNEQGKLEIACQFCKKNYSYGKEEVDKLWEM